MLNAIDKEGKLTGKGADPKRKAAFTAGRGMLDAHYGFKDAPWGAAYESYLNKVYDENMDPFEAVKEVLGTSYKPDGTTEKLNTGKFKGMDDARKAKTAAYGEIQKLSKAGVTDSDPRMAELIKEFRAAGAKIKIGDN